MKQMDQANNIKVKTQSVQDQSTNKYFAMKK